MNYRKIAPPDTWPWLRMTLLPLPWTWQMRPRLYIDDVTPWAYATFDWLCFHLSWSAQDRPIDWFTELVPSTVTKLWAGQTQGLPDP